MLPVVSTRFELKSLQKNRIERGLLGTLILVAPNLHQTARHNTNFPNVGKATKIKEEHTLSSVCLQAVYNLEIREKSCQGVCGADTFYPFTAFYSG